MAETTTPDGRFRLLDEITIPDGRTVEVSTVCLRGMGPENKAVFEIAETFCMLGGIEPVGDDDAYETMVFDRNSCHPSRDLDVDRYPDESAARPGHDRIIEKWMSGDYKHRDDSRRALNEVVG